MKDSSGTRTFLLAAMVSLFAVIFTTGCGRRSRTQLVVYGPPSLADLFARVADAFHEEEPDLRVRPDFVCPPCVSLQQSAKKPKADVFIATGEKELHALTDQNLVEPSTAVPFAQGRLAIVARQGAVRIRTLADLATPAVERIVVGDPKIVSSGYYFLQTLKTAKLWRKVSQKVVYTESGCRVVRLLRASHKDVAAVFAWCASQSGEMRKLFPVPDNLHAPVVLYGVKTNRKTASPSALRFLDFLKTQKAIFNIKRINE